MCFHPQAVSGGIRHRKKCSGFAPYVFRVFQYVHENSITHHINNNGRKCETDASAQHKSYRSSAVEVLVTPRFRLTKISYYTQEVK